MKVKDLIMELKCFDSELEVQAEGCDCIVDFDNVKLSSRYYSSLQCDSDGNMNDPVVLLCNSKLN